MSKQDQLGKPYDRTRTDRRWSPPLKDLTPVLLRLHTVLADWVGELDPIVPATTPIPRLAEVLLDHLDDIATRGDAGILARQVTDVIHRARKAIDRPLDQRIYLGPCGARTMTGQCAQELYGVPWRDTARCGCGAEHPITARHEMLRQEAQAYLATAATISRFLRSTGMDVTAARIRGLAARGRLVSRGPDKDGHPTYQIGDVLIALSSRYKRTAAS